MLKGTTVRPSGLEISATPAEANWFAASAVFGTSESKLIRVPKLGLGPVGVARCELPGVPVVRVGVAFARSEDERKILHSSKVRFNE